MTGSPRFPLVLALALASCGRIDFDRQRVGGTGDTVMESAGLDGTPDRYLVAISGGAGRIA